MDADHQVSGRLCFGIFEVDLRAGELRKRGLRVRLQQQPFQVLAMLLEHHGQVVGREDLQKKLWPADTFVDFDHGLNKAINKIREALGDSAESPRFVETVARRGYRFLADVRAADAVPVRSPEPAPQPHPAADAHDRQNPGGRLATLTRLLPPRAWKISTFVLLALLASFAASKLRSGNHPSPVIRSLAVLPLESLSNDASQDYFADGMTDELVSDLGQISALRVISRTSVMAYKHTRKSLPQIARETFQRKDSQGANDRRRTVAGMKLPGGERGQQGDQHERRYLPRAWRQKMRERECACGSLAITSVWGGTGLRCEFRAANRG